MVGPRQLGVAGKAVIRESPGAGVWVPESDGAGRSPLVSLAGERSGIFGSFQARCNDGLAEGLKSRANPRQALLTAKRPATNRKVASVRSGCQWGSFLR